VRGEARESRRGTATGSQGCSRPLQDYPALRACRQEAYKFSFTFELGGLVSPDYGEDHLRLHEFLPCQGRVLRSARTRSHSKPRILTDMFLLVSLTVYLDTEPCAALTMISSLIIKTVPKTLHLPRSSLFGPKPEADLESGGLRGSRGARSGSRDMFISSALL
jgi:hypothetical protein